MKVKLLSAAYTAVTSAVVGLWLELKLVGGLGGMNVIPSAHPSSPCSPQLSAEALTLFVGLLAWALLEGLLAGPVLRVTGRSQQRI